MVFTPSADCAQGTTVSFGIGTGKVTSVSFSQSANVTDISDLSIEAGGNRKYAAACLKDSGEVSIDFIGGTLPAVGEEVTITFDAAGVSGLAIVKSASMTCAVGELTKGQATYMLSGA